MKSCDSITIYYMSDKAPEVISRPKYVIWNAEGKYRQGECDFFRKSGARFIQFFHSGKSSISSTSFAFSPMKSPQANEESLFVLGQASEGSCYEISKVNQDGEKPRLNIEIHDVCMDTYMKKLIPITH